MQPFFMPHNYWNLFLFFFFLLYIYIYTSVNNVASDVSWRTNLDEDIGMDALSYTRDLWISVDEVSSPIFTVF